MRKQVLLTAILSLFLPCLGTAEPMAPASAADQAFIAALSQEPADPLAGIGIPAPSPRVCSVTRSCGDGNTVHCDGGGSCVYSTKGVTCDSTGEIACPHYCEISAGCPCGGFIFCRSLSGNCMDTNLGISCDGREVKCPGRCP